MTIGTAMRHLRRISAQEFGFWRGASRALDIGATLSFPEARIEFIEIDEDTSAAREDFRIAIEEADERLLSCE